MFNSWGIRKTILFLVLTPAILVSLLMSIYFVGDRMDTLKSSNVAKGRTIATSLMIMAESSNLGDKVLLGKVLTQYRDSDRDILAIAILNRDNQLIVTTGNDYFFKQLTATSFPTEFALNRFEKYLQVTTAISFSDEKENYYLSILLDRQPLILEIYHTIFMAGIIVFSILAISLAAALHLSRTIGTPLQKISFELEAISKGELDVQVHTPEIPELANISHTINSLSSSLLHARENMQQNVEQATSDLTQTLETIEIQNIELDMARKQAIQASRVKSEFLANISHEIRTPMNGVIGFTNLLLNSKLDITQKDYLMTIRKSANNLLSIIEDILDFSKIEAGRMSLEKVSFSLRDCVEEVVTMLFPSSVKKHIELIPLIYKNVPDQLLGDPIRIKQVLTNLISNAIKFTEKGSIVVRILLEEETEDTQVIRTTITDTGIGMTDEQINKLFQPFSQVNQNINRHHSGTGLGLVISKKLVEQMGGEISVESRSNEGTSFSYTLISEKLTHQNQKKSISLPQQSVLIYDQHPMALLAMKQLLSSWDMDVYDFQSIDKLLVEANNFLNKHSIKPIIMLGTSEDTAYLTDVIVELGNCNHRGIFLLGKAAEQQEVNAWLDKGVEQYLEKPLTRKLLQKTFAEIGFIDAQQLPKTSGNKKFNTQFKDLKILAVDDNPANLKLLTIVLEEMTVDVVQAYDGLSSVEICKEEQFDLIFMDIRMPGLDGIEASQRIKQGKMNRGTPIIALTAHAMAGEKEQLLSDGLADYMTKPVNTEQLQQIISKWTGQIATPIVTTEKNITSETNDSIDWSACLDISGGREQLARDMLGDLVSAIPEFQELISIKNNDADKLLSDIHKLHGLACYTGVPQLKMLTAEVETMLKSDATSLQRDALITSLLNELTKIENESSYFLQVS